MICHSRTQIAFFVLMLGIFYSSWRSRSKRGSLTAASFLIAAGQAMPR